MPTLNRIGDSRSGISDIDIVVAVLLRCAQRIYPYRGVAVAKITEGPVFNHIIDLSYIEGISALIRSCIYLLVRTCDPFNYR